MQAQLAAPSTLEQVPPCVQTNPLHGSWVPHLSPLYPGGQAHVAVLFGPESEQVPPCWHLNPSPHGSVAPAAVNMMASSSVAAHAASAGAPGLRRLVPIVVPASWRSLLSALAVHKFVNHAHAWTGDGSRQRRSSSSE